MMRMWVVLFLVAAGLGLAAAGLVLWPINGPAQLEVPDPESTDQVEAIEPPTAQFGDARLVGSGPQTEASVVIEEPARAAAPELPAPALLGIVRQNGELTAWLSFDGAEARAAILGDEIEGWRLTEISETRLVVEASGRREVLGLFDGP